MNKCPSTRSPVKWLIRGPDAKASTTSDPEHLNHFQSCERSLTQLKDHEKKSLNLMDPLKGLKVGYEGTPFIIFKRVVWEMF